MDIFFQNPPRPVQIWPAQPPPVPADFVRPARWADKHFGQWCRNMSMDRHTQCPRGSPFHWYICCGEGMAECCFGIQTWVLVIFGSLLAIMLAVLMFALWLGPSPSNANGRLKTGAPSPAAPMIFAAGQHQQTQAENGGFLTTETKLEAVNGKAEAPIAMA